MSLTVAALDADGVEIALIPHTLDVTTLGTAGPGDAVNLEVDVIAKYVERLHGRDRPMTRARPTPTAEPGRGFATIEDALADLRAGRMVLVVDDADRENEGDFIIAAEHCTPRGAELHGHPRPRHRVPAGRRRGGSTSSRSRRW